MVEMKNTVFFQGWTTRHNTIAEMQILIDKSHESIIFPRTNDYKIALGDFKFSSMHSWFITRMLISRINFTAFFTWLVFSRYLNLG